MLSFIQQVRRTHTSPSPVVVHCSAGIGRTGTYMLIDDCMRQLRGVDRVADVAGTLLKMRTQRGGLVQTLPQYAFVHQVGTYSILMWRERERKRERKGTKVRKIGRKLTRERKRERVRERERKGWKWEGNGESVCGREREREIFLSSFFQSLGAFLQ